jgi:broad specificity phosphatase PhoE
MSFRLILVRHGETDWTRDGRYAGSRDVVLNALGIRQCQATATALAERSMAAVYATPLERARTSAEIVAKPHRLAVFVESRFREMSFGAWEGLTRDEAAAAFPEICRLWWNTPHLAQIPGAETLGDVRARVLAGLGELRAAHDGETVVLVTHGVVVRLLVLDALGLGSDRLWALEASPAGITELEYEADWATIHRMNTLVHLDGLST